MGEIAGETVKRQRNYSTVIMTACQKADLPTYFGNERLNLLHHYWQGND